MADVEPTGSAPDEPRIDELMPEPRPVLSTADLLARYGRPGAERRGPWLRANFVTTLDGSATGADGLSGSLSSPSDRRVFGVLRRLADAVLVGARTVGAEGYAGPLVDEAQRAWRRANGLAEHPALVLASRSLRLDPASPVFAESPVRVVVATSAAAPREAVAALAVVADVVVCGGDDVDPVALKQLLDDRGLRDVLCEGGPSLLGALIAADAADELCLTMTPLLVGGSGPRIAHSAAAAERRLRLAHVLRAETGDLHLRLTRP